MLYNYKEHDLPCPVCGGNVEGRKDKIYCSIDCKNKHHYNSRNQNRPLTEEKNRRLLRNLTLLQGMAGTEARFLKVAKEELTRRGFDLESVTGARLFRDTKGRMRILYECYHFSYYENDEGILVIEQFMQKIRVLPGTFERWEHEFPKGMRVNGVIGNSSRKSRRHRKRK